ncbi:MAG TPA: GAF domain-containing protein, partial [Anaerolineae bacterium]|nr:GAF domain-containing protein [Anaerolineae bacterium]
MDQPGTRSPVDHREGLLTVPQALTRGSFTREQIEAVRAAAMAITARLTVEQVLVIVAEQAAKSVNAAASLVYLVDTLTGELRLIAGFNVPELSIGFMLKPDENLAGPAALSGQPQIASDPTMLAEVRATFERIAPKSVAPDICSAAAVPLIYSRQVLGVLEVIAIDGLIIDADQIALLQLLASHAATAVTHAQLHDRNQQVMSLLEMINDRSAAVSSVGQAVINAGHDQTRMSLEVLTRTIASLHLAGGKVFLEDPITHQLAGIASENLPREDIVAGLELAAAHCLGIRQTILLQNMSAQAWTREVTQWLSDHHFGRLVCIPLIADNEPVGVLQVAAKTDQAIETGMLDTLHIIAGQLALGVANARLFNRVRAEQQQLAAILSSSSDVLIGLNANGDIQLANPAAERTFDFVAQAVIGQPLRRATQNATLNNAVDSAIKSKQRQPSGMEIPLTDDQTLFCNLSPIIDPLGQLAGWVAVMQDITHFKEAERSKTDMILMASHDLRNPVNLTLGALDLLGRSASNFNAIQREAYELSLLGLHRIEALISNLLDLERIEQRIGLNLTKCDLTETARSVVNEMRLPAQQREQKLWLTLASTGNIP